MKTFSCECGNTLFFGSIKCLQCDKPTTMCPACRAITPTEELAGGKLRCAIPTCHAELILCENNLKHKVCNRSLLASDQEDVLCEFCRLNQVIPDLTVDGNLARWGRLEAAKHRVLYGVRSLGFPIIGPNDPGTPELTFDFKADGKEPVHTGHADGCITINIKEADSIEREKRRVEFGEAQRTLVGHFRHELGHYYWDMLVKPSRLEAFRELFGHEQEPTYADAMTRYYEQGPADGWEASFISGYATMHPWEDFAETFAAYLDMGAVLSTIMTFRSEEEIPSDFNQMLNAYRPVGIVANELNRDLGLLDLVPEVFTDPVIKKLRFVHELRPQT